ncbi:MAG TPA: VOC family protein [Mycobacteriales bacterium]|jgi:predicted enzyme related to lactoylglutathione lyase|nr:VOC family protein [Mycobacteriales bacterium]
MDVLSSRVLLRSPDPQRSQRFYRDVLGLAVYREFGPPDSPGIVFFLGHGFLEVAGHVEPEQPGNLSLWLQVRDAQAEYDRLRDTGVTVLREPRREPWGLIEGWIADPDGTRIALIEVPADHPLRRDQR